MSDPSIRAMNDRHECSGTVNGDFHRYPCQRNGKILEDGTWWCHQHAPLNKAAKDAARRERWKQEDETNRAVTTEKETALRIGRAVIKAKAQATREDGTVQWQQVYLAVDAALNPKEPTVYELPITHPAPMEYGPKCSWIDATDPINPQEPTP